MSGDDRRGGWHHSSIEYAGVKNEPTSVTCGGSLVMVPSWSADVGRCGGLVNTEGAKVRVRACPNIGAGTIGAARGPVTGACPPRSGGVMASY